MTRLALLSIATVLLLAASVRAQEKVIAVKELPSKHFITWKLADGTRDRREISAQEYVALGRKNPTYPAKPDAREWAFEKAEGGVPQVDSKSGALEPGQVVDSVLQGHIVVCCDDQGFRLAVPKTIYKLTQDGTGAPQIEPDPVRFTLRAGVLIIPKPAKIP